MTDRDDEEDSVKIAIAETKIDHLIEQVEALRSDVQEFQKRVQGLERWRAWLTGAMAALTAAVGFVLKH